MSHPTIAALDDAARSSGFSGVIRLDSPDLGTVARGYGLADRAHGVPMTAEHRLGAASVGKGFTALAVGSLIDEGRLGWDEPIRPVLGSDLPLIDDTVTVRHLLSHTSGIGDYLDESEGEITDYVLDVPVQRLDRTEAFVPILDGRAQVSAPGAEFQYNNAGFVVAALVAERVSGLPFDALVTERVFRPAGMTRSGYPRSDEPAGDIAVGYLFAEGGRTNQLHLPVRGSGDGGVVTTAADLAAFWAALHADRLVSSQTRMLMTAPESDVPDEGMRYGRGFWLGPTSDTVILEGYDAGVSGRTWHSPGTGVTGTVIANWSDGAWPVLGALDWV